MRAAPQDQSATCADNMIAALSVNTRHYCGKVHPDQNMLSTQESVFWLALTVVRADAWGCDKLGLGKRIGQLRLLLLRLDRFSHLALSWVTNTAIALPAVWMAHLWRRTHSSSHRAGVGDVDMSSSNSGW